RDRQDRLLLDAAKGHVPTHPPRAFFRPRGGRGPEGHQRPRRGHRRARAGGGGVRRRPRGRGLDLSRPDRDRRRRPDVRLRHPARPRADRPAPLRQRDGGDALPREGNPSMSVVATMSISLDNIGTGHHQTEERPFGDVPEDALHRWMFDAPQENQPEIDAILGAGAYVMGRNMFGPVRGEWDRDWRGWWGPNPPYHAPVFVLTHYPHDPI